MKIRMKTNLGTVHAKAIGADAATCRSGEELTVSDAAGRWLVDRRMADELPDELPEQAEPPAVQMKAVPPSEPMHPQVSKSNRPPIQRSRPFKQTPYKEE